MLDMSWGELMVIGGVALVVIKPKDLPKALRTVGQMTAKVRRLAGEFQAQFSEAMREAELEGVKRDLENINRDVRASTATAFNPIQTIRDEIKSSVEGQPATAAAEDHTIGLPPHAAASEVGARVDISSPETAVAAFAAEQPAPVPGLGASGPVEEAEAPPSIEPAPVAQATHPVQPVAVAPLTEEAGPGLEGSPTPGTAPPGETTPHRDRPA